MSYYKRDVEEAKIKIAAACPDVKLEDWADYGFRLTGYKIDPEGETRLCTVRTVFQPGRADNDQQEIIADVDELIAFWRRH
jgi:hypothetical protein